MVGKKGKKVAIIQSNYIPWKGYFDIINMVDEFILYDDVQYTKGDWRNRNRIKTLKGTKWLTIPVKHNFGQKIIDTVTQNPYWMHKHWDSIQSNYVKAQYFSLYKTFFKELYVNLNETYLSRINYQFLKPICDILGIKTKFSWVMDYKITGGKTERLVDLCRKMNATEYLTGSSAKSYIKEDLFAKEGIKLNYMDYSGYPEYQQLYPPFEHQVSIIDLIFNTGPNATQYMKSF
jgi:hypothetical protein